MSREDGQGTHEILLRFRLDREGVMEKVKRPSAARGHCLPNRHVRSMPQLTHSKQADVLFWNWKPGVLSNIGGCKTTSG